MAVTGNHLAFNCCTW